MFHRFCTTVAAVAALLAASACTDPREAQRAAELATQRTTLNSQLQEADSVRSMASQAVVARQRSVQALDEELSSLQSKAAWHQRAVEAFMMDHKMAVAALAAGAAGGLLALDDSGSVSQEAREIGAVVGIVALGWALFNQDEVLQVANELVKAESTQQALNGRIEVLQQNLAAERDELQQAQTVLERVNQQASSIRTALQGL